ncbi:MAG: hypothetical protein IKE65_02695 [Clostridia bacterium]|nr:hypothetical protein [Clostridia bacterium]
MYIIYESDSGFTKRYAEAFAQKTGLECHSLYMARIKVKKHSDVIFFGRVMQNEIDGFKKARKKYNILALCPVGLRMPTNAVIEEIAEKNELNENLPKLFYLRGGFDPEQNQGLEKTLINLIISDLESKGEDLNAVDAQYLSDLQNGADYVNEENLAALLDWYENC